MDLKSLADLSSVLFGGVSVTLVAVQAVVIGAKALHYNRFAQKIVEATDRVTWLFRLPT